jgi:hypothetical protein
MHEKNNNETPEMSSPREGAEMQPQETRSLQGQAGPAIAQAWDPYDVWLNRVKLPRERHPHRLAATAGPAPEPAAEPRSARADAPTLAPGMS